MAEARTSMGMAEEKKGENILNTMTIDSENLYLECCHGNLAIQSQIVIFVLRYCMSDGFQVLLCNKEKNSSTSKGPSLKIPADIQNDWLTTELPNVVLQSKLPTILTSDGLLCCVGLCIVLRRIVQRNSNKFPERNFISLLGFQLNCLKGFAEGSSWTKYCELDLPDDIHNYLADNTVPASIHKFEKCLSLPVKISNKKKHQRKLRKSMEDDKNVPNISTSTKSGQSSCGQDSVIKNINLEERQGDRIVQKNVPECNVGFNNEVNCEVKNSLKKSKISPVIGSHSKTLNQSKEMTLSKECIKSNVAKSSGEYLPELEHLFAEGINMTLIDLVIFPCVHLFLDQAVQRNQVGMFWQNPLILQWYQRMWNLNEVKECAEACGMTMIVPPDDLLMIPSNSERPELQVEVPNSGGTGMKEAKSVSKRGMRMAIQRQAETLLSSLNDEGFVLEFMQHPSPSIKILWEELAPQVHPAYGDVPDGRSEKKCHQIENIVGAVKLIAEPGDNVVDFCSGGGHLGIALAALLPECHIILVESKEVSLFKALKRVQELGMKNVTFYLGNIDYYHGKFNIGVSLHACGVATDMVITRCVQSGASFVSSPCCYGAVRNTHVITYPRSEKLQGRPLYFEDYRILAHAAEHTSWDFDSKTAKQAKSCMAIIDSDRLLYAGQHAYQVWMTTMQPYTCTPKNNLLIGVAENRQHKLQAI